MARPVSRQVQGTDLEELRPYFDSARAESALPEWLERAILQDAGYHQPKAQAVRQPSAGNGFRAAAWRWRFAGLFTASAGAGLAIGMGSAGAVEAITVGFSAITGVAGADIFSGLDALLLE